ncbi:hypothetical protein [Moheibacter lacus]|uniref:Uncharacterized protein n=1 Tax=Moheibacter lacus TaxID=2745851 RepID=A0A838ZG55_9FLAO|nr:hypothetical protein [Moheibacter lacus]MBA5628248.1 hypothetical protein [Moheibacter lacus]
MKRLLVALFLMISPIILAKKLILATCEMGNGCTFQLSELDATEYDIVDGNTENYYANLPENAIVVDVKVDGNWENYVELEMSRSQLDKFYGGDGFTMIYPFNPNFQPLDGQWKISIGTVVGDVCYGQTSNLFKSMLEGKSQSGIVTFPKPFHGRFLMNSSDVKWMRIRPNLYRGYFGNHAMNMVFIAELKNEKLIEGLITVTIRVPTKEDCINKIPISYTCVKPKEWEDPVDWDALENENPKPNVPLIENDPKPNVPLIEDDPKPNVPYLEDEDDLLPVVPKEDDLLPVEPKGNQPNVPRIEDPKPNVLRIED